MSENREFLMLAQKFVPEKHRIGGWYASDKLDGQRAFWDGGVSRGKEKRIVPWANMNQRHEQICTGLWSRLGNVIAAPDWWLDKLPREELLDGELYIGPRTFEALRSIVGTHVPDEIEWKRVKYYVIDQPAVSCFGTEGRINNPQFSRMIDDQLVYDFLEHGPGALPFYTDTLEKLKRFENDVLVLHMQIKLCYGEDDAREQMERMMERVLNNHGEGLILRDPGAYWIPHRVKSLLKYKPFSESEGTVIGFIAGEGKYLGMIGSLTLNWKGKRLQLSGFTDIERYLPPKSAEWATLNPGCEAPVGMSAGQRFMITSEVRFIYRELSAAGIPKEARYWR